MADSSKTTNRKRKAHAKSRHGCTQCKRRHQKCDEVHPICGQCERLSVECSLSSSTPRDNAVEDDDSVTINDLRYLHHWLKGNSIFDDHDPDESRKHADHLMELAFSYRYLLHTVLSIAALEMFDQHRQMTQYYEDAVKQNLNAIRHARPNMTRSDAEHSEALFTFSALTSLFAFAEPPMRNLQQRRQQQSEHDLLDDLLGAFRMGKGNRAIMSSHGDSLVEVKRANEQRWSVDTASIRPTLERDYPQLAKLRDMVTKSCESQQETDICGMTLEDLFENISALSRHSGNHSSAYLIMTWASSLDPLFIEMCEARHPVPLVILAHYAVMIQLRGRLWFFTLWPELILDYVRNHIGDGFKHYLDWPAAEIERLCKGH